MYSKKIKDILRKKEVWGYPNCITDIPMKNIRIKDNCIFRVSLHRIKKVNKDSFALIKEIINNVAEDSENSKKNLNKNELKIFLEISRAMQEDLSSAGALSLSLLSVIISTATLSLKMEPSQELTIYYIAIAIILLFLVIFLVVNRRKNNKNSKLDYIQIVLEDMITELSKDD